MSGEFETHLTVSADTEEAVSRLKSEASARGMKMTHIVLAAGTTPSQPMLTFHSKGTLDRTMAEAVELACDLRCSGLKTVRIKVETHATHPDAPITDQDAANRPDSWHFEHHVKLCLSGIAETEAASRVATVHGAQVSRNALRRREDAAEERFLTQRLYGAGSTRARVALQALQDDLIAAGLRILSAEAEYVVADTNTQLDSGWLEVAATV